MHQIITHHEIVALDKTAIDQLIIGRAFEEGSINSICCTPAAFKVLATMIDEALVYHSSAPHGLSRLYWEAEGVWVEIRPWHNSMKHSLEVEEVKSWIRECEAREY